MNKLLSFAAALLALTFVASCDSQPAPGTKLPTVAIATLMSHPALDDVRAGVIEGLAAQGLQEGHDFHLVERNANGQIQVATTIAGELAAQRPTVIVAIATPMAQAIKARWQGPLVFAAVTDPVGAGLVPNLEGSSNVTGTSDAWPYQDQLKLIKKIQPNVRRIGVIFNPAEASSQYGMNRIRDLAPSLDFTLIEVSVSATGEVAAAAKLAAENSDALFLSSDNTVISAVGAAFQEAVKQKKALYVGDSGTVERGGLAAVSVGYRALGVDTGTLTARMLHGERNLPVIVARGSEVYINQKSAALMGIKIPEAVLKSATRIFETIRN